MKTIYNRIAVMAASVSLAALSACGGGGGGGGGSAPASGGVTVATTAYAVKNLVSDQSGVAVTTDPNLVDAWGVAFGPSYVWVANNGTNTSTLYDGNGVAQSLVVAIPNGSAGVANPTGTVYNGDGAFQVTENGVTGSSTFIFVGEGGTVSGWAANVDLKNAITVYDGSAQGAVFKGVTLATGTGATTSGYPTGYETRPRVNATAANNDLLFVADFHNNVILTFDSNFNPVTVAGGFKDASLPAGYAPFNIQALNGQLYVAYAQQQAPANHDEVDGAGLGIVDVFDTTGTLVKRLVTGGTLNAPWGLALAPANFGTYSGALLVGNFGDGKINAYNASTGAWLGALSNASGTALVIPGLWGIGFGNGADSQPTNTLFFASGPSNENHGLYGRIDMQ